MSRFLACWDPGGQAPPAALAELAARESWVGRICARSLRLWTEGKEVPVQASAGGAVVIGRLFPRLGAGFSAEAVIRGLPEEPEAAARRLVGALWGGYVALFSAAGGLRVLRDPTGAGTCLTWSRGDLQLAASDLPAAPAALWPAQLSLNWSAIADILDEPIAAEAQSALDGLVSPLPGRLEAVGGGRSPVTVWTPAAFAGEPDLPAVEEDARLKAVVDHCVSALARDHRRLLGEISGGLDSAVVAASLAQAGEAGRAVAWLNYYTDRREGDERGYARLVAERIGVPLTCVAKDRRALVEADFIAFPGCARPPANTPDPVRDLDTAERLAAAGATALLSGQGGDAVFFQPPAVEVAADRYRLYGRAGLSLSALGEVARLSRTSLWGALGAALRAPRAGPPLEPRQGLPRGWARPPRAWRHPWYGEAAGLPPAKRLQIQAIANAQLLRGDSRRGRAGELLYPLLAQPVVELCLRLPIPVLTRGGRERGLARAAFAERLPAAVIARRGKGDLGAFYGPQIAASLDFIRPHLLDGALCEAGLLDRDGLDQLLRPEQLIWRGAAAGVLQAVILESWVRHWQTRVPDSGRAPRARPRSP